MSSVEDWYNSVHQANARDDEWTIKRFAACRALKEGGIPCYIWSEDALFYYGVPTGQFDINIVVNDVEKAAKLLIGKGWLPAPPDFPARYTDIEELTRYLIDPYFAKSYLTPDGVPHTVVALMAASDWNITLPDVFASLEELGRRPFIPSLQVLLDSLIGRWLDSPDQFPDFRMHLAIFLAYLYQYVPILKSAKFAQYLRMEHRQYHHDVVSGMSIIGPEFLSRERRIRDQLREGIITQSLP